MKTTPSRRRDWRRGSSGAPRKRLIAVLATLVVFGGIVAVTQVSNAGENRRKARAAAQCAPATTPPAEASPGAEADPSAAPDPNAAGTADPANPDAAYHDHGSIQHPGDGQATTGERVRERGDRRGRGGNEDCPPASSPGAPAPPSTEILGNTCENSGLEQHDGFQLGDRCVSTSFGEVADAENNASLVITQAPQRVRANQQFTIRVSTRNLVRDRFLAAGAGGYYKESAFLSEDGLVRGHFHTACRMLTGNRNNAPDPAPVPAFFVATEDSQGGAQPDEVVITIPGLPERGQAQCASWAGDNSHRIPMMTRANQVPAFDVVRITVR